jgi:hypothetical protein
MNNKYNRLCNKLNKIKLINKNYLINSFNNPKAPLLMNIKINNPTKINIIFNKKIILI